MSRRTLIILIVVLLPLSILIPISILDLRFEESRRGLVTLEMLLTGNYIVPKLHGWDYLNKPPFFNWAILPLAKLFGGLEEWMVRLPSLLGLFGMSILNYFVTRKFVNKETAILSSLLFLTAGDIYFFETTVSGEMDLFFSFFVLAQILCIFLGFRESRNPWWLTLSWILMAAGAMTKGLPAFVFQALTLLGWTIYTGRWNKLFHYTQFIGAGIVLLLFYTYGNAYAKQSDLPLFISKLLMEASEKSGLESRWTDILLTPLSYPFQLMRFLAPWSLLVPFLLNKQLRIEIRKNEYLAFTILFIAVNILPYAFTSFAKSRYIYMFFPFFCLWLAYGYEKSEVRWTKWKRILDIFWKVIPIIVIIALPILFFIEPTKNIPSLWISLLPWGLLLVVVTYQFWKSRENNIYHFILIFVIIRFLFNGIYFPLVKESDSLQLGVHARKIAALSGKEEIHFYGIPDTLEAKGLVAQLVNKPDKIIVPPFITYSIPYYITREKQKIMPYSTSVEYGKFYLGDSAQLNRLERNTLYKFTDNNGGRRYEFFRLK